MSAPLIDRLIDKRDSFEIIRDELAAIIAAEVASQKALALAEAPPKNPLLWDLRVFLERSNPWEEFRDTPDPGAHPELCTPIVHVWYDSSSFDRAKGDVVERQQADGVFNIDCYGYGVSRANGGGHDPGDRAAALECHRAVRLVRNILMAATYTYLGQRGLVAQRWVQSITSFQIEDADGQPVQRVKGARVALEVRFNEYSPQVHGEALELISFRLLRKETGQVYFTADYGAAEWES